MISFCYVESKIPRAQAQLTSIAATAKDVGLMISVPKTKYMIANCLPQPTLSVYCESINPITEIKYRGSKMAPAKLQEEQGFTLNGFLKAGAPVWKSQLHISTKVNSLLYMRDQPSLSLCRIWGDVS